MVKELLKSIKEDGEAVVATNGGQGDLGALPNNPLQVVTGSAGANCWGFRSLIQQVLLDREQKLKRLKKKLNKDKEETEK